MRRDTGRSAPLVTSAADSLSVLHVGLEMPHEQPGGLNSYVLGICRACQQQGMNAVAVVTGHTAAPDDIFEVAGESDESTLLRLFHMWRAVSRLSSRYDLIDGHFALPMFFSQRIGRSRHLPVVMHFHGPWADEHEAVEGGDNRIRRWIEHRVRRWIEKSVYQRAQCIVVMSMAFQRLLIEKYRVEPWKIRVVPPGVDMGFFQTDHKMPSQTTGECPRHAKMVFAVRRLVPRMGLAVLLRAWVEVQASSAPQSRLVIAGTGPELTRLKEMAEELGISDTVEFVGHIDHAALVDSFRNADLSVVPSLALEGFGLVVLESLATGTPVIACDVGGLPEALQGLNHDLVVPPGDAGRLAERIIGGLSGALPLPDPDQCRAHARRFTWANAASRHREIYQEAARITGSQTEIRRLRVVIIGHSASLSGGELAILRLVRQLAEEVDLHFIVAEDGPLVRKMQEEGATVEILMLPESARALRKSRVQAARFPVIPAWHTMRYSIRLARRLRKIGPDVVHTNTLKSAIYGGIAARMAGIPCVWHVRDRIAKDYLPGFAVASVQFAARYIPTRIVANSATTRGTLGSGVDALVISDTAAGGRQSPERLRDNGSGLLGAPSPKKGSRDLVIGMVGRLAPWKGQDLFLRAFALAFPFGRTKAVIVGSALFGESEYEKSLVTLADELGLSERVEFLGFQEDIPAVLERFDLLVHGSIIPEPFGQVVIEGMAAGLPVIAADAGGPAEVIQSGLNGLLYPPGDADAMASCMATLAQNEELRRAMGTEAQVTVSTYTPERVAPQLLDVYRSIARP
jgi:glycosyltransferase involved in cell wall biosynthesis